MIGLAQSRDATDRVLILISVMELTAEYCLYSLGEAAQCNYSVVQTGSELKRLGLCNLHHRAIVHQIGFHETDLV